MRLAEQFIDTVSEISQKAQVSVVPLELANISGLFQGLGEITNSLPPTPTATTARAKPPAQRRGGDGPWASQPVD